MEKETSGNHDGTILLSRGGRGTVGSASDS